MSVLKPFSRVVASLLVAVLVLAGTVTPSFGVTLAQKKAEAAAAATKLTDLRNKAEIASEQYNQARVAYDAVAAKVNLTKRHISTLTAQQNTLQTALGNRADEMYRDDGDLGILEMLLSAQSIEDFNSIVEMLTRVSEQDATTVAKLKSTRAALTVQQATLVTAEAEAAVRSKTMKSAYDTANARAADATTLLNGLNSQVRTMIAAEQAAAEAAARLAWERQQAATHSGGGGASTVSDPGGNPPTSSKGALAVYWAKKALGSWYEWGAAGPSTFDCSGLCMWAYAHAGVSLPHYSGSQYESGPHVSRANLEPGDLLFFGSPIHHVGMYIGGGEFIEAPYTGARVRIATLGDRYDYVGATRPQ